MFLRLSTFLFISLLALQSYAASDLILFVSASKEAPQIALNDYSGSLREASEFASLVKEANKSLSESSRPVVLNLEVMNLEEVPEKLKALTAQDASLANARIRMMFLTGHGNREDFYLHRDVSYRGQDVARFLMSEAMQPKLAKDFGVYLAACKCGESIEPTTFQVELMTEFKTLNEQLEKPKQIRSLVTLAHRFFSTSLSFKMRASGFDTILYEKGVFKVIERMNNYFLKYLGRYVAPMMGFGMAAGLYTMAAVLRNHVSPDAVGPAVTALLDILPAAGIGLGFGYNALTSMSTKWAQRYEYTTADISSRSSTMAVGDGVWQMINMTGLTCESIF